MNPRVALLSFLAWDPNCRIANAASVGIVFGDMLPRTESTAPLAMGLGKHATGLPVIDEDEIVLVCWMAVDADADQA